MWIIYDKIVDYFLRMQPKRMLLRPALNITHELLVKKAMIFTMIMVFFLLGGFFYDHYFASSNKEKEKEIDIAKNLLSKIAILTIFLFLNFFINKLHIFMYIDGQKSFNPYFWPFALLVLILLFGFLTINSKLVPDSLKLNETLWTKTENIGNWISLSLLGFVLLYSLLNSVLDPVKYYYILLFIFLFGSLFIMRNKIKKVNMWIFYAFSSLFMINNYQYMTNREVGKSWYLLHYIVYAIQIAMMMFGLIKNHKYNFFEVN